MAVAKANLKIKKVFLMLDAKLEGTACRPWLKQTQNINPKFLLHRENHNWPSDLKKKQKNKPKQIWNVS